MGYPSGMGPSDLPGRFARWSFLGTVPYEDALELQERLAAERSRDACPDTLLLLQHPPTITLGRRGGFADLRVDAEELARRGIGLFRIQRGGGATWHGPGQLVGYAIVRLGRRGTGVREFVAGLEDVLIGAAARLGVSASRSAGKPGAWAGTAKFGFVGIEVRRGVTRHGFALNVAVEDAGFSAIVPCGMPGLLTTDLSRQRGLPVAMEEAVGAVIDAWEERFGPIEEGPVGELGRARIEPQCRAARGNVRGSFREALGAGRAG